MVVRELILAAELIMGKGSNLRDQVRSRFWWLRSPGLSRFERSCPFSCRVAWPAPPFARAIVAGSKQPESLSGLSGGIDSLARLPRIALAIRSLSGALPCSVEGMVS
jgi:hypothetical protein